MLVDRIIGVFRLDPDTFEEIEHDPDALLQAAIVVTLVALLGAFGSAIGAAFGDEGVIGAFFGSLIWSYIGWFVWSFVTFFVGTSLFNGQATVEEMLRVIGFAQAPLALGIIPCIGWLIGLIWSFVASFIAIRQGLDLDNANTCLTIIVGFVVYIIGQALIGIFVGGFNWLI